MCSTSSIRRSLYPTDPFRYANALVHVLAFTQIDRDRAVARDPRFDRGGARRLRDDDDDDGDDDGDALRPAKTFVSSPATTRGATKPQDHRAPFSRTIAERALCFLARERAQYNRCKMTIGDCAMKRREMIRMKYCFE